MVDFNRRHAFRFAFAALPAAWLVRSSPARADQAFRKFFPLLVDLQGWEGKTPDGMSMEMGSTSMLTATREYHRGPARLNAGIIMGPAATGALGAAQSGMNIETSEGHMIVATVDGFPVVKTFTIKEKSGALLVKLGTAAMFSFSYNGLTEDEAVPLAKRFDWKAIQAMAQQT